MVIRVWAPLARRVRLRRHGHGGDERADVEMAPDGDGAWWEAPDELVAGDGYGFVLDGVGEGGGELLPDPRSRRQPDGVAAASVHFDPLEHAWTDQAWTGRQLAGGVVYELHLGTFTDEGTLDAAISRLDHLVDLGVTHVELLPVNGFPGDWNWGYDGVDWYTVDETYGGPYAYQRFVDAAHGRGLAVLQDVVYNHLGPVGNYLPQFGPFLRTGGERNTWGDSVNLDETAVRRHIVDNALMWMRDYHCDGLRLDAVHALKDDTAKHILQQLAEETDALSAQLGRPLTLIAESDLNDPKLIGSRDAGGYGLTAQWADDWHHAVHVALTGETSGYYADFADAEALPKAWAKGFFHDGTFSSFRGRNHGFPIPAEIPTWRLVTFAQDHDQIGNRAAGDRLAATLSPARLEVAAVLTLTAPGTPMLFMGEEWGASTPWQFFTHHHDPELAEAVRKGRVEEFAEMGWDASLVPDPQDPETFRRSKLRWDEVEEDAHAALLELYRTLARLRRRRRELTDPAFGGLTASVLTPDASPSARAFRLGRGDLDVLVNLTAAPFSFDLRDGQEVVLSTDAAASRSLSASKGRITLAPDSTAIVAPPISPA